MFGTCCGDGSYKGTVEQSNFEGVLAIAAHLKSIVGLQMSGLSERKSCFVL